MKAIMLETHIANAPLQKVTSVNKVLGKCKARAVAHKAMKDATAAIVWKLAANHGIGIVGTLKNTLFPSISRIPMVK